MERDTTNYYQLMLNEKISGIKTLIKKCLKSTKSPKIIQEVIKDDLADLNCFSSISMLESKFDIDNTKKSSNLPVSAIEYMGNAFYFNEKLLKLLPVNLYTVIMNNGHSKKMFIIIYDKKEFLCPEEFIKSRIERKKHDASSFEMLCVLHDKRTLYKDTIRMIPKLHCNVNSEIIADLSSFILNKQEKNFKHSHHVSSEKVIETIS